MDLGELPEVTARREMEEETGLDLGELKMIGVYADIDPNLGPEERRDPRGVYATVAYYAEAKGKLSPDAEVKEIILADPLARHNLVFDHDRIVSDALKMYWPK